VKHILVVDDDAAVLSVMARALSDYWLTIARDGREALAIASGGVPVDLLITDYLMPSMTGDELIARLREKLPGLKTLIVTAHGDILAGELPDWWQAEAHLSKPFRVEALREAVAGLIGPPA
jgi:CheY-like chemotaxis protein